MIEGAFEARKWGWRQTKEGIVVSFLIHPNDINAALAVAPLGTIYAIGFREMPDGDTTGRGEPFTPSTAPETPDAGLKDHDTPRQPFHTLPPTTQAVLACKDKRFIKWSGAWSETSCADWVRKRCGVRSRSELNTNNSAAEIWRNIYTAYRYEAGLEAEPR